MTAAWLPRPVSVRGRICLLALFGAFWGFAFGALLNLWFWPFGAAQTQLNFVPGDAVVSNLHRFVLFSFATSSVGWDTGRAITNVVAIVVLGPTLLVTLRRSARRAAFGSVAVFVTAGH